MNAYSAIIGAGTAAKMLHLQMQKRRLFRPKPLRAEGGKVTGKDGQDKDGLPENPQARRRKPARSFRPDLHNRVF